MAEPGANDRRITTTSEISHTNQSATDANGKACAVTGPCALFNRECPESAYQAELVDKGNAIREKFKAEKDAQMAAAREDAGYPNSSTERSMQDAKNGLDNLSPGFFLMHYGTKFGSSQEDGDKLSYMESLDQDARELANSNLAAEDKCRQKHSISKEQPLTGPQTFLARSHNIARQLGPVLLGVAAGIGGGRAMQTERLPAPTVPRSATRLPKISEAEEPPPPAPKGTGTTVLKGEPVDITDGGYVEDWPDFQAGTLLVLDGTRHLALKLKLPIAYNSPLGPARFQPSTRSSPIQNLANSSSMTRKAAPSVSSVRLTSYRPTPHPPRTLNSKRPG